jgi:hypothetical protein
MNFSSVQLYQVSGVLTLCALSIACGDENAARVAPWLGISTVNESKADTLGRLSIKKAKACQDNQKNHEEYSRCLDDALEPGEAAEELYKRDCGFGNRRACAKLEKLRDSWHNMAKE